MKQIRKTAVCLLAVLIGCASAGMTGCGQNTSSDEIPDRTISDQQGDEDSGGMVVYSPTVPENPISEDEPGDEYNIGIGEQVVYEGKLEITLDKVVEIDSITTDQYRVLAAELTIVNQTGQGVDCSSLTHFGAIVDGEETMAPVRDVQAAIACRKYYTAIGEELQPLNQLIEAGETHKGYIYLGMPTTWSTLELTYIPYKYYSNDTVVFDIPTDQIEHYTGELS